MHSIFHRILQGPSLRSGDWLCHPGSGILPPGFYFQADLIKYGALRSLTLILTANRLILALQYGSVMWFTWRYKQTRLPLALKISTIVISSSSLSGIVLLFRWQSWLERSDRMVCHCCLRSAHVVRGVESMENLELQIHLSRAKGWLIDAHHPWRGYHWYSTSARQSCKRI